MNHIKKQASSRGFKSPIRLKSSIGIRRYKYNGLTDATTDPRSEIDVSQIKEKTQTDPPDESTRVLRKIINKSPIHVLSPINQSGGNSKSKSKTHADEAPFPDAETDVSCKSSSTGLDPETIVESMSVTNKSKRSETREKPDDSSFVGSTSAGISRPNGKGKSHTKDDLTLPVPERKSSDSDAPPKNRLLPKENMASTGVIQTNKSTTSHKSTISRKSKTSRKPKKKPDPSSVGSPRVVKSSRPKALPVPERKSSDSDAPPKSRLLPKENMASTGVIQTNKSTTSHKSTISRKSKTSRKSKKKPDLGSVGGSPRVVKSSRSKAKRGDSVSRRNSRSELCSDISVNSSTSSSYGRNTTIHLEVNDSNEDDIPFMEREILFLSEQFVRSITRKLNSLGLKTPAVLQIDDRDDEVTDERVANNWFNCNSGASEYGQDDAKRDDGKATAYESRVAAEKGEDDECIHPPVWYIAEPTESGSSDCGSVARGTYMRDLRDGASRECAEDEAMAIPENIEEDECIHPPVWHFRRPP